jgi:hypothetical protein
MQARCGVTIRFGNYRECPYRSSAAWIDLEREPSPPRRLEASSVYNEVMNPGLFPSQSVGGACWALEVDEAVGVEHENMFLRGRIDRNVGQVYHSVYPRLIVAWISSVVESGE